MPVGAEGTKIGDAYVEVSAHLTRTGQIALQNQLKGTVSKALADVNNRMGVNLGQGVARASNDLLREVSKNFRAFEQNGAASLGRFEQNVAKTTMRSGGHFKKMFQTITKDGAKFFSDLGTRLGIASFQVQMFGQALTMAFTLPALAGAGLFAKSGLTFAANVDKATAGLKAMLPVGYDVEALIGRLNKLAVNSAAFNADDVITYTQKLTAAGNPIKDTEKLMGALSNIFGTFGVTGENASLAMLGISQIFQKGKVQGEELTKQISQQIPIWKLLAEGMGVSQAKLTEMVSNGQVSAAEFQAAMVKIGNSKQFLAGANNAVNTLSGAWQMFKEQLNVKIGMAFLENKEALINSLHNFSDALTPIIDYMVAKLPMVITQLEKFTLKLKEMMDQFQRLTPEQQERWTKLVLAVVALGPALLAISKVGTLGSFVAQLVSIPASLLAMGTTALLVGGAFLVLAAGFAAVVGGMTLFILKTKEGQEMWAGFKDGFAKGWDDKVIPAIDRLKKAWEELKPALNDLLKAFGFNTWREFGEWLGTQFAASLATVIDKLTGFLNILREVSQAIAPVVSDIRKIVESDWDLSTIFNSENLFPEGSTVGNIRKTIENVKKMWDNAWESIFGGGGKTTAPGPPAGGGGLFGKSALGKFADQYGAGAGGDTGMLNGLLNTVRTVTGGIKTEFTNLTNFMNTVFKVAWDSFWALIPTPMTLFQSAFNAIFGPGQGLQLTFQIFVTNLLTNLGTMIAQATSHINRLLGLLNGAITAVNVVLPKALKIPAIGPISGGGKGGDTGQGRQGFASGGKIGGKGSSTGDRVPIMGSRGEWVINAKAAKNIGEAGMRMINSGKWPQFAAGHLAVGGSINAIIAAARTSGIGHTVGSTFRPGPPYHGTGQAVDFPGSRQDRFAQWWMQRGQSLLELIHDSGSQRYGVKHGRNNPAAYNGLWGSGFMGGADNGHTQHVHVASNLGSAHEILSGSPVGGGSKMSGPGIGGGVNWMGQLARAALDKALGGWTKALPGADGMGNTAARGIFAGVANGLIDFVMQSLPIDVASGGSGTGGAVGSGKWGGLVGSVLKEMGLPLSHVANVLTSISQESGGNPNAVQHGYVDVNTATGDLAKGLNQVIGATFRSAVKGTPYEGASQFDPRANIYASIRYAMNRYGSKWSEVMARPGGYDNGGFLPPGGLAMNTGRASEMVLNPAQSKALTNRIAGDGDGDTYIVAYIDGVETVVRAEIYKNNKKIADAIERGRK